MCVCKYIIYNNNNNISMFISTGKQFQQKQAWLLTQIKNPTNYSTNSRP